MKSIISFIIAVISMSFVSCRNTRAYDKYVKELDSLKIVLQQSIANFKTVDSASCVYAYSKQYTYSQFIEIHLRDTVTKTIAENLQKFNSTEKGLKQYLAHRTEWLNKANVCITQLQTLSHDLKNGSVNEDEAIEFINEEKKHAEQTIEELKKNTEIIRKHIEVFNESLPVCETIIKQLNSGELPQLITDNNKISAGIN